MKEDKIPVPDVEELNLTDRVRGKFILKMLETFRKWRGPEGQAFQNQFIAELMMGKLALAWAAEQAADKAVADQLDAATKSNTELSALNAQLTAQQGVYKTPGGYTPDADDGPAIDQIIAKHPTQGTVGVPMPKVKPM